MRITASAMPESNAGFAQVVGGHLDIDSVAYADADKMFAHFAGNVSEDLVAIGQSYPKHCPGKDLRYRTCQFNWLFLRHLKSFVSGYFMTAPALEINIFERKKRRENTLCGCSCRQKQIGQSFP